VAEDGRDPRRARPRVEPAALVDVVGDDAEADGRHGARGGFHRSVAGRRRDAEVRAGLRAAVPAPSEEAVSLASIGHGAIRATDGNTRRQGARFMPVAVSSRPDGACLPSIVATPAPACGGTFCRTHTPPVIASGRRAGGIQSAGARARYAEDP